MALVRLAVGVAALLVTFLVLRIAILGADVRSDVPLPAWRRGVIRAATVCVARILLFCLGYMWIRREVVDEVGGAAADASAPAPSPRIVIGNHVTFIEVLWVIAHHDVSFVSKVENLRLPIVGPMLQALQCVFVRRASATDRHATAAAIKDRVTITDDSLPKLSLFPEATTTSGRHIIRFKRGAFMPLEPVLPLVFVFDRSAFDPMFSCRKLLPYVVGLAAQPWNTMVVLQLPPQLPPSPSSADDDVVGAFAAQVRDAMTAASGMPLLELQWEDKVPFDPKYRVKANKNTKQT